MFAAKEVEGFLKGKTDLSNEIIGEIMGLVYNYGEEEYDEGWRTGWNEAADAYYDAVRNN